MESISTAMPEQSKKTDEANDIENKRYLIDVDWFRQQGRSLAVLVRSRLCPSCQAGHMRDDEVLDTIKRCCSQAEGFIALGQPLLEMAFRVLLANGGQPMSLADMQNVLKRHGTPGSPVIAAKTLDRVLSRDSFYGIRPAPEEPAGSQPGAVAARR